MVYSDNKMMKSEDGSKDSYLCGSRLRDNVSRIFDCFLIVSRSDKKVSERCPDYKYPPHFNDKEILQQSHLFCFPFNPTSETLALFTGHADHFTFILTDIEGKHRFGFCKLTHGGSKCFCILSFVPWFEIFYKILNYVYELSSRRDEETIETMLMELYQQPVPFPNEKIQISATLAFSVPDTNSLPSIPENRNLSEYYAAVNIVFMMDIFASLMFERRIIFTSNSLSVLTSCIHSAEALLMPLHWQHIFIPVMPPHLLDYCLAPMPFLVGVHSSLMPKVRSMIAADDDVIVANIDKEEIESIHNDAERIPNDIMSFLKSLLRKPNVAMGSNLSSAFLRTQARLIGGYRNGLKFKPGEAIVFNEDSFIDFYKSTTAREFARSLVQLQTFKQFVDGRLDMLNAGIGFRDDFENEVNMIDAAGGREGDTYKEWLNAAKKGGNKLIMQFQRKAKDNMRVAQQSLKNYIRQQQVKQHQPTSLNRVKSLDESTQRIRPTRPPPISAESLAEHRARRHPPPRPAPPLPANPPPKRPQSRKKSSQRTRVYTELDLDHLDHRELPDTSTSDGQSLHPTSDDKERSLSSVTFQELNLELLPDMQQAYDEKLISLTSPKVHDDLHSLVLIEVDEENVPPAADDGSNNQSNLTRSNEQRKSKEIRRRSLVSSRPNSLKMKKSIQSYSSDDLTPDADSALSNASPLIDLSVGAPSQPSPSSLPQQDQGSFSQDLVGLDFTSLAVGPTTTDPAWSDFQTSSETSANPFAPNPSGSVNPHKILAPTISNNPFVTGRVSSGSSRTSSPSKTPQRLSPQKLSPFKRAQTYESVLPPNYNPFPSASNDIFSSSSKTEYKTSPVRNSAPSFNQHGASKALPLTNDSAFKSEATFDAKGGSFPSHSAARNDNDMFSDLVTTFKSQEGL